MCWIENIERLNLQRTDKDIEVYKIVSEANKQSCKSIIRNFIYKVNTVYEMSSMTFERTSISDIYYNSILKKLTIVILRYVTHSKRFMYRTQFMSIKELL